MAGPFQAIWGKDAGLKGGLPAWKGCLNQPHCCPGTVAADYAAIAPLLCKFCAAPAAKAAVGGSKRLLAAPSI